MSGYFQAPGTSPPTKSPGTHSRGGLVGPRAGLDVLRGKKSLVPAGI